MTESQIHTVPSPHENGRTTSRQPFLTQRRADSTHYGFTNLAPALTHTRSRQYSPHMPYVHLHKPMSTRTQIILTSPLRVLGKGPNSYRGHSNEHSSEFTSQSPPPPASASHVARPRGQTTACVPRAASTRCHRAASSAGRMPRLSTATPLRGSAHRCALPRRGPRARASCCSSLPRRSQRPDRAQEPG